MPSDEYDRNLQTRVSKLLLEVQAIDSRKAYIQYQATGSIGGLSLQELFRALETFGPQISGFQQALYRCTYVGVVIDHEYRGNIRHSHLQPIVNSKLRLIDTWEGKPR